MRLTDFVPGSNDTNYEMLNLDKNGQPQNGQPQQPGAQPEGGGNNQFIKQDTLRGKLFFGERKGLTKYMDPECPCCPNMTKRYTIAILVSVGFVISFGSRCNIGVAQVKMFSNETGTPEFDWTSETVGVVDSSYFWGYIITQVPGGFLAAKYPANRVFGTAIALSAALNILLPSAAYIHPGAFVIIRIFQGFAEGVTYPACHGIWRHWAPPIERSKLATIAFCGSYGGLVLSMPVSGVLSSSFGWQSCFIFYGLAGVIWYVVWLWLSFEKPCMHPTISQEELIYIEESLGNVADNKITFETTPWKAIFMSMPVYAIIVANFCRSWTFYLLIVSQPKYFKDVFGMDVESSGFLGALPHLLMTMIVPLGGHFADTFRSTNRFTTTQVRKIFNCGGFGMEALFLVIMAQTSSHFIAMCCLILAVGFSGFAISGFNVNHLDIAPRYASILMGISNGFGTLAGMFCPIVTEKFTHDRANKPEEWASVFELAGTIHFLGVIFYAIFASGELQEWSEPPNDPNKIPNWKIRQMSIKQPSSAGPNSQAPANQLTSTGGAQPTAQAQVDIHGQTTAYPLSQQQQYGDWNNANQDWGDSSQTNQYDAQQQGYGSTGNYGEDGTARYRNY